MFALVTKFKTPSLPKYHAILTLGNVLNFQLKYSHFPKTYSWGLASEALQTPAGGLPTP